MVKSRSPSGFSRHWPFFSELFHHVADLAESENGGARQPDRRGFNTGFKSDDFENPLQRKVFSADDVSFSRPALFPNGNDRIHHVFHGNDADSAGGIEWKLSARHF